MARIEAKGSLDWEQTYDSSLSEQVGIEDSNRVRLSKHVAVR